VEGFSMQNSIFWRRPGVDFPSSLDTMLFDIDGVLVQTIDSFHATDIAAAEYVAGTIFGLDWGQGEGKSLFTHDDVLAFKQAGGYNNDWDMCYLLATLGVARLREWKGASFAARSSLEWAALSRVANVEGHGGITWVRDVMPATAQLPYNIIGDIYHELYWGASEYQRWFGRPPRYLPDCPGFVKNERMLFPTDFFARLRKRGIQHMGMITGRVGPEVESVLERIEDYCGERWWDVVIPADVCPKPDPRALRLALEGIGSDVRSGLYIGDTGDDLDVVLNYRATSQAGEPGMLAVMLVRQDEVELYQQRGADMIVGAVTDLLE
jgi:HAD superfamily phosphatase